LRPKSAQYRSLGPFPQFLLKRGTLGSSKFDQGAATAGEILKISGQRSAKFSFAENVEKLINFPALGTGED